MDAKFYRVRSAMQNMAYPIGMIGKSGLDAKAGNLFRTGVLLKNFIIKFNSRDAGGRGEGGREEERFA